MKTAQTDADVIEHLNSVIQDQGYAILSVDTRDPQGNAGAYSYTVGLCEQGMPELFIVGNLTAATQGSILLKQVEYWQTHGVTHDVVEGVVPASNTASTLRSQAVLVNAPTAAQLYMERLAEWALLKPELNVQVAQLLWPDASNRLPGEPEYQNQHGQRMIPGLKGSVWDDTLLSGEGEIELSGLAIQAYHYVDEVLDFHAEHELADGQVADDEYWGKFRAIPDLEDVLGGPERFVWGVMQMLAFGYTELSQVSGWDAPEVKGNLYNALVEAHEALTGMMV